MQWMLMLLLAGLTLIDLPAVLAAQVTLAWDANTESNLAGYRIHCGASSRSYTVRVDVGKATRWTLTGLEEGQSYFFAATAYNQAGNESGFSEEVSCMLPLAASGSENPTTDVGDAASGFEPPVSHPTKEGGGTDSGDKEGGAGAVEARSNRPPAPPKILSPTPDAIVGLAPNVATEAFRDPDRDDWHSHTRWQIRRIEDSVMVLDVTSEKALTRLVIPVLILKPGTAYGLRCRFADSWGESSEWSDEIRGSTENDPHEGDRNGSLDARGATAPAEQDGDGLPDSEQLDVQHMVLSDSGATVEFEPASVSRPAVIETVAVRRLSELLDVTGAAASLRSFVIEPISLRIRVAEPGGRADIDVCFSVSLPREFRWMSFDPYQNAWRDLGPAASPPQAQNTRLLSLRDGGPGDMDGTANGIIVATAGVAAFQAADSDASSGGGSGSGSSGCFIAALLDGGSQLPDSFLSGLAWLLSGLLWLKKQ
jgi:hypothetical protein